MHHQLTLEIPDEVYAPLAKQAELTGQTVEAVAGACLAQSFAAPPPGSLLRKWVGFAQSGVGDIASRHRDYLGDRLRDELEGRGTD
jgi:hypothetical protein